MTQFGSEAADQVIELTDLLRRRLGPAVGSHHPSPSEVRNLIGHTESGLARLLRNQQLLSGRPDQRHPPESIGVDQHALRKVARVHRRDIDRETRLIGGLMQVDGKVADQLLDLVDARYLLNRQAELTWRRANEALQAGEDLSPRVLSDIAGGIDENILSRIRSTHGSLTTAALLTTALEANSVGLHRHAIAASGEIAARARRGDQPILELLPSAIDAVHTVDEMAADVEQAAEAFDPGTGAGPPVPLVAANHAMAGHGDSVRDGRSAGEGTAAEPAARPRQLQRGGLRRRA